MAVRFTVLQNDDLEILNLCTKYLGRTDGRPSSEAWSFPIIESDSIVPEWDEELPANRAVFVYKTTSSTSSVSVRGTFAFLYDPIPLRPVLFEGNPTSYVALTVRLPAAQTYRYRFIVDGVETLDPVNPQITTRVNGAKWSRFFSDYATRPLTFQDWELSLIFRLVQTVLPFRSRDVDIFLRNFYSNTLKRPPMGATVGEVNYIDKVVTREENHHLTDYKLCLTEIDRVLSARQPGVESWNAGDDAFDQLYKEMASGNVPGWDFNRYREPAHFLRILRRHAVTGAFCHPKYGGNVGGVGWAYLSERYKDPNGASLFDWKSAIEPPLGTNSNYRG